MTVIIDAGHGRETPGKRSPDGRFREWEFNRKVAECLDVLLHARGVEAARIVTEDRDMPLSERCNRANALAKDGECIFVSCHANAAGNGAEWQNARGFEVYTSQLSTAARKIVPHLYRAVAAEFPDRAMRGAPDGKRADFYVLRKTCCPAVLVEAFFYDNREECAFLMREDTACRVADALAKGICGYIESL